MVKPEVMEAPSLQLPPPADPRWRQEYAAFIRMLPELLGSHRGEFAAIHGGRLVAVGDTFVDAATKAYAIVGYVPLHVGLVSDEPAPVVRIPSPHVR